MSYGTEILASDLDSDTEIVYCPACKRRTECEIRESLNWGNLVAMCDECDSEFAYTPIDHKAILREARRGW